VDEEAQRLRIFDRIERFIFIAFRIGTARSNYRSSVFYRAARDLNRREATLSEIAQHLDNSLAYAFDQDGKLRVDEFHSILFKKFEEGTGYYGWSGLRHFLYEYEQHLRSRSRQQKVDWDDLLKSGSDRISIEHIYPQTPVADWEAAFANLSQKEKTCYAGSLGNLLLLSMSINASLQNDAFYDKKQPRYDASGAKIRNGYSDGSHSEIQVAENVDWGPEQIRARGQCLLVFMEKRWGFALRDDDREKLLFLSSERQAETVSA
jgi:hypothetical protein